MREKGGWGGTLSSNKQSILCFNKKEAAGELQDLKSLWTQQVDFLPEQDECGGTEAGEMGSRAGSDQVPSLKFQKFVILKVFFEEYFSPQTGSRSSSPHVFRHILKNRF